MDYFLSFGNQNTGLSFHQHSEAWNGLIWGRKRWFVGPETETSLQEYKALIGKINRMEWLKNIYPKLAEHARPRQCWQEKGDLMYVPNNTIHAVWNEGEVMAVSSLFHNDIDLGLRGFAPNIVNVSDLYDLDAINFRKKFALKAAARRLIEEPAQFDELELCSFSQKTSGSFQVTGVGCQMSHSIAVAGEFVVTGADYIDFKTINVTQEQNKEQKCLAYCTTNNGNCDIAAADCFSATLKCDKILLVQSQCILKAAKAASPLREIRAIRGAPEDNDLGRKRHFTVEAGYKLTVKFLQLSSGRVCLDNSWQCKGGSIFFNNGADVVIQSCAFVTWPKDNGQTYEARDGVFIRGSSSGSTLLIEDSTFIGGRASAGGGALSLVDVTTTILRTSFKNCQSNEGGGALALTGNSVTTIRSTSFKNCQSINEHGGAINNQATTMYVFDSTFESNTANKGGGAVFIYGQKEDVPNIAEFSSTKFIGNVAKTEYGGAIVLHRNNWGWSHWHSNRRRWWGGWSHWHNHFWKTDATFKDGFNMFVGNKCEANANYNTLYRQTGESTVGYGLSTHFITPNCGPGVYQNTDGNPEYIKEDFHGCRYRCPPGWTTTQPILAPRKSDNVDHWCNVACPKGYYCPNIVSSTAPVKCPAGTFGNKNGNKNALCNGICPAGYFCPEGTIFPTDNPCPSANAVTSKPGAIAADDCPICLPGTVMLINVDPNNITQKIVSCTVCAEGKYQPEKPNKVSSLCLDCPQGTYLKDKGVTPMSGDHDSLDDCKTCLPGLYFVSSISYW